MRWIILHVVIVVMVAQLATGAPALGRAQESSTPATAVELPATPVGSQLAWLITLLNGGTEPPTEEDVASHFTPAALAQLPAPLIIGVAQQFAETFGPFAFEGPARPATPNQIVGYLTGRDGANFLVVLATEATPPHQLTGAALLPMPPLAELPPVAPESLSGQFDVGGREIFLSCSGTGSPTVILEAGYGDSGGLWAPVQNGVAPLTRVCSYDRPNVSAGASDPAPTPRTPVDQVADLHALLTAANVRGPYILAAHSYGGLISRLYAAAYPGDVVGMVLVDTVHEDRAVRRQAMVSPRQWAALQDLESEFSDFERIDEETGWEQVRQAQSAAPLRPMPLVVLAAGVGSDPSFFPPDWPIAEEEQLHQQLQVELAELSPSGEYVLVAESGHYIQLEQPNLVIDAIAGVIETVRTTSGNASPAAGTPTTTLAAIPETVAGTPVGASLDWILTLLNDGAASLTPDEMTARFAPAFLQAVPPEIMVGLTQQIAAGGPYTLVGFTRPPTATQVNALLIGSSGTLLVVPVAVEVAAPHRITGVNFAPLPPPPGVQRPVIAADEAPLAAGELRTAASGRFDGLFEVNGHQIYLSCLGTGSPTVVLESGHNDPAAPWFAIERAVAPFTRVCTYDRPNTAGGASDPVPTPGTAEGAIDDLHALLAAAGVPGPYVLAGHSLGGLIIRLYASTYPDEVVGLVLVDSSHEEQDARLEELVSPALWRAYQDMMANVLNIEKVDFDASFAQVREARAAAPLRPMPLIVVSAGAAEDPSVIPTFFPPGWPAEVMPQLHRELQADLVALVPNGRLIIAEQSGHYVHQSQPELVVEAIRDVVGAVRDSETWAVGAPSTQAQAATPTAPGALVDIGDRSIYLSCSGTGSPTVILESGLGDTAAVWSAVQREVARTTRVCSYDRANVPGGASDPSDSDAITPRLRSAAELVADLHALLAAAAVPGPYVLVGHSVGGLVVRLYAATYPHDVTGLVLVDATHEDNWARLEEEIGPELWPQAVEQFTQAVTAGILEPLDLEVTAAEVRDAREERPLPAIPLIVLTHTQPPDAATLLPGLSVEASERYWSEHQADLTTLLPNSQQILAEGSGHYVQQDRPDLVIDAIADVIETVRDPGAWIAPTSVP